MSLQSRDNVQAKCTELVVIRARMSDLLWITTHYINPPLSIIINPLLTILTPLSLL